MNEPWMPSDDEIDAAALSRNPFEYEGTDELRALIRATVEKALAEERDKWTSHLGACAQNFLEREEKTEARHRRDVLNAQVFSLVRIEALLASRRGSALQTVRDAINALRAELAALGPA